MSVPVSLRRLVRPLLVLLLLVGLAVPAIALSQRVQLRVDGEMTQVRTYGATVAEVLEDQGVEMAAGDEVVPAPSVPVEDGTVIRILRSIDVVLEVDGEVRTVRGAFRTVEGALDEAGVEVGDDQLLEPAPRTSVDDGDRIVITSPHTVTVTADGASRELRTHLASVGRLLEVHGVRVGEDDILSHERGDALVDGMEVVVQRVESDSETEEVELEFTTETRDTSELFRGETRVAQEGETGLRVDTYRLTLVDGEVTDRELAEQEVVREPVPRIVEEGTAERPPPPPPAPTRMADDGSVWYDLARCESGGRWNYDGPYDGGLQFHPDTWTRWKPSGAPQYAWQASPEVQIQAGKRLQANQGWSPWPSCASKLGLS